MENSSEKILVLSLAQASPLHICFQKFLLDIYEYRANALSEALNGNLDDIRDQATALAKVDITTHKSRLLCLSRLKGFINQFEGSDVKITVRGENSVEDDKFFYLPALYNNTAINALLQAVAGSREDALKDIEEEGLEDFNALITEEVMLYEILQSLSVKHTISIESDAKEGPENVL